MASYVASHLKDMNRYAVYNLINELEFTSRAEISKRTGISAPTVIKIVSFLIEAGLVLELGDGESSVGRKPQMLTLNKNKLYSAVFFLEGEILTISVVDIVGQIKYIKTLKCEPDFGKIMEKISIGLVDGLFAEAGIPLEKLLGIGVALPGIYDINAQTITAAPMIGVRKPVFLGEMIRGMESKYGVQVLVENDANCQCYGEFKVAKMPKNSDLLLISLGTGLGAGLILDGKLRHGANFMCGEIGYISFHDDYVPGRGNPGWLEKQISHQALEEKFGVSYGMDTAHIPSKNLNEATEYVGRHLALCISNIAVTLDCTNVRLCGLTVDFLGDGLIDCVNKNLEYMCDNKIDVQKQYSADIGSIGISAMLTEKYIVQVLMEKEQLLG
ncbi:MAG: ROK family transcriptional regulator [Defluviitaleaceae bacterium]|nr:ROK family transcriptional regulator [Defluviitaleaceae bacterium]